MVNRDIVLLETVKTHRARLLAAFLFGDLAERRTAGDNLKRLTWGMVLAAVACVTCVAVSLVTSLLAGQAAARAEAERQRVLAGAGPATLPPFASDTFDRRRNRGWGSADLGGTWELTGSGPASVDDGAARLELNPGTRRTAFLPAGLRDDTDATVTLAGVRPDTKGSLLLSLQPRRVSSTADYRLNARLGADDQITISLEARKDDEGVVPLSDTVTLRGSVEPGDQVFLRAQAFGTNPTTVRAKVWWGTAAEPQTWMLAGSDTYAGLQRPGAVGIAASLPRQSGPQPQPVSVVDLVARPVNR